MKRYVTLLLFVISLAPRTAWAQAGEPLACTAANEAALRGTVARLLSAVRIAQYRADAALLEKNAADLELLLGPEGSCPEVMKTRLCDAECHYQRASVRLFRATGVPILSSKSSSSPGGDVVDPGVLLQQANEGLAIVEEGIAKLPRQQVAGGGDAQKTNAFNRYLKSLALLYGMKAKLLLAAGDTWYRAASVSQLTRLAYVTGEVLGDEGGTGGASDEYAKALTYYDEAFWLVTEARGTLPVSDVFAGELATLAVLDKDVGLRLSSVRKGQLYIGIDPEDFTFHGIEDLGRQLAKQRGELERQENAIADLLRQWAEKYKELEDKNFDVTNMAHERAIDNEVYKIARLEDQAALLKAQVQGKLDVLSGQLSTFERERQIRIVQASLVQQKMELTNEIRVIQGQKEQDLLALAKEDVRDKLDAYRFNIDMALAQYNFRMQIDALDLQLKELEGRVQANEQDIRIAEARSAQLDAGITLERQRIAAAKIVIDRYRAQQGTVYASEAASIAREIDAVDAEIAWYGGDAQAYGNQICAARAQLLDKSKEDIAKIKACLESGCPGSEGLKATVDAIQQQNLAMYNAQRASIQKTLDVLRDRNSELVVAIAAWHATKGLEAAAIAASAAASVAAAVPKITVGLVGVFPTELVEPVSGVAEALRIAAETATQVVGWAQGEIQFMAQVTQEMTAIQSQVTELDGRLKQLDVQKLLDQWATKRALAEINVQLVTLGREANEADQQKNVQTVECRQSTAELGATAAKLRARRASLVAQLSAKTQESSLLDYDIEQQQNLRGQSETAIRRLVLEQDELRLEMEKSRRDVQNLRSMQAAVNAQKARVAGFESRVKDLERSYDAKLAVLGDIKEKIRNKTIQISVEQQRYVEAVIENEERAASSQIADLKAQIQLVANEQSLLRELTDIETSLKAAVVENRNRILELASKAPTNETAAIVWDFEELTGELTRGAAEILEEKRALLQNINFTYNLYRNRYDMLTGFTRDVRRIDPEVAFIRTAADVTRVLGACGAIGVGTPEICDPKSLVWSRSTITGLSSEFTIEQNSGLLTQLLRDGRARFEVSPFASASSGGKLVGNFTLWDDQTMSDAQAMPLIHVVVGVAGSACRSQQITVRHLGWGVEFAPLSGDSSEVVSTLVSKAPVAATVPVYGDSESSQMVAEYTKFRDGSYTANRLEQKLQDGTTVYPFVGYPLVGTYELVADDNLLRCLASGAPALKLGFVFARK